jgi:hypothetical protein
MQNLCPDATVLLQKELLGKYLIKCYNNVRIKVDAWLAQGNHNCWTSGGCSSVSKEAFINFMLVSAIMSLFLNTKYAGKQGHSASFVAKVMSQVIKATQTVLEGQAWTKWQTIHVGTVEEGASLHVHSMLCVA